MLMWGLCEGKLSKHIPCSYPGVSLHPSLPPFLCCCFSSFLPASSQPVLCSHLFHGVRCFFPVHFLHVRIIRALLYRRFFKDMGTRESNERQPWDELHCNAIQAGICVEYFYKTMAAWGSLVVGSAHWWLNADLLPCLDPQLCPTESFPLSWVWAAGHCCLGGVVEPELRAPACLWVLPEPSVLWTHANARYGCDEQGLWLLQSFWVRSAYLGHKSING